MQLCTWSCLGGLSALSINTTGMNLSIRNIRGESWTTETVKQSAEAGPADLPQHGDGFTTPAITMLHNVAEG